jgi:aryl-alcohol dehydrogenase-like predicted oxidoreductase
MVASRRTAASIDRTIGERLSALAPFPIDLYQVHFGFGSLSSTKVQMRAMARLVEQGSIAAVGVGNLTACQMQTAHAVLADYGVPLASNQIQLNLLHRSAERNGVLETARRLGVTLIAYSPLREGVLTGRFHADPTLVKNVPPARRAYMGITARTI